MTSPGNRNYGLQSFPRRDRRSFAEQGAASARSARREAHRDRTERGSHEGIGA